MKKMFTLLCAGMICLGAVQAEVLLTEHFAQTTETLATNDNALADEIAATGWTNSTGSGQVFISSTDLTYAGYKDATDGTGSAEYKAAYGKKVTTPLKKSVKSGTVYAAAIMDITACNATTAPSRDYLWAFTNATSGTSTAGNHFARLCVQKSTNTFQLGVAKNSESAAFIAYTDELEYGKYLIVMEYQFIDGEKNDIVSLYINPTKGDKPAPTITCKQSAENASGTDVGSGTKADPAQLAAFMLYSTATTKIAALIDEIKIVTDWAELWAESSVTPPVENEPDMAVQETVNFYEKTLYDNTYIFTVFAGKEYTQEVEVLAENLTEDITLTHTNSEISLSTNSLPKAGGTFTITLNPTAEKGDRVDTLVYTSGTLTDTTLIAWGVNIEAYSTLATLKAGYTKGYEGSMYYFTGEAIVTRTYTGAAYLQDATAAILLSNEWSQSELFDALLVGDKVGAFLGFRGEENSAGVIPFIIGEEPNVLSTGKTVEAQVVTLADLQAHADDYLLEIVTIKGVTLDQKSETFKVGTSVGITQGDKTATLQPINAAADYIGLTIPDKADVTGFSINKSGTVIVPRDKNDIVTLNTQHSTLNLILNPCFENYENKSFLGQDYSEFENWNKSGFSTLAETNDVYEGATALRLGAGSAASVYQQISNLTETDYADGTRFELRIHYKAVTMTTGGSFSIDSYWEHTTTTDALKAHDADQLQRVLSDTVQEAWQTLVIETTRPANAKSFLLQFRTTKNCYVLIDSLRLTPLPQQVSTEPYITVTPTSLTSVSTTIGNTVAFRTLHITQGNLEAPTTFRIGGTDAAHFTLSATSLAAEENELDLIVTYAPKAAGTHSATLIFDNTKHTTIIPSLIPLHGSCTDPNAVPTITVTPTSLPTFTAVAGTQQTQTVTVKSENCTDAVYLRVDHVTGEAFTISNSMIAKNWESELTITFSPKTAGTYQSTVTLYTEGGKAVVLTLNGTATPATPETVDWATTFAWDETQPLALLDEHFDDVQHNRPISLTGWQNVADATQRPWWGFDEAQTQPVRGDGKYAKATAYQYQLDSTGTWESWLVTPALDYQNAQSKIFAFSVMGEYMPEEGNPTTLEVVYIDATNTNNVFYQVFDGISIPTTADENNTWIPFQINLDNQPYIDIFHIAFHFKGPNGNEGAVTYYIDDVSWGRTDLPNINPEEGIDNVQRDDVQCTKVLVGNMVYILRNGDVYTITGQKVK